MNKCVYLFILLVACNKLYGQAIYTAKALSLPDAIEIGLKNNPEMGIAAAQIKAVEGKFWTGISLPQPEFSVGYDFVPTGKSLNNYSERTIGISQAIEFPSTYFLRGTKLSKEKEIASLQFKVTQLGVISRIKSAYVILAANHEYIKIASENLAIAEDFADKADIRYNAGEGTNLERLTAKVQYAEATNNEELHKNQLLAALAEFNFALGYGKDADRKYMLTDTLSYRAFNMPLEKLIGEAMGTSPQLNIAELHVRSSVLDKTLAWTSLLPSFNLAYFKQYRDGNSGYYGASLGIAIPLWGLFDRSAWQRVLSGYQLPAYGGGFHEDCSPAGYSAVDRDPMFKAVFHLYLIVYVLVIADKHTRR